MENLELLKIEDENERNAILAQLKLEDAIQMKILNKKEEIKKLEDEVVASRQDLLDNMTKYDIKTLELNHFTISRVAEATRVSVDSKKLKTEMPEIFDKYSKKTKVKSYLKFTIKKDKQIEGSK